MRLVASVLMIAFLTGGTALNAGETASACVPVGDPVYGFLENCAVRGILPIWSVSRRPLSREAVGGMLRQAALQYHRLDDRVLEADLDYFLREFANDVKVRPDSALSEMRTLRSTRYNPAAALENPHWHTAEVRSDQISLVFDPLIWFCGDWGEDKSIFRRAAGIQFRGDYREWIGFYFRFVDHVERGAGSYSDRSDLLEDRWGYVGPLQGGDETYYDMTEAYLTARLAGIDIMFGKDRASWGSSDGDGLLLSGTSPSFSQFRMSVDLFEKVRFCHLVGYLHPYDVPEDMLYQTEAGWTRVSRPQKWIAAHRVEYLPWESLSIAVNEAVIWGDRGLDPAYVNPLNFYYSAEHDGGDQDNVLMSGDISFRVADRLLIFGELLIDDMKVSTLGDGDPGNKFGCQIGAKFLDTGLDGLTFGVDYVRLDPYVYKPFFYVNRYTTWTSSLGSSIGANSDRLRLWTVYRPVRQLELSIALSHSRKGEVGSDPTGAVERNHTGRVDFLDGNPISWTSFEGAVMWEPMTGIILRAGYIDGDKRSTVPDRFFLEAGYRY